MAWVENEEENHVECDFPGCGVRFSTVTTFGAPHEPDAKELADHEASHENGRS